MMKNNGYMDEDDDGANDDGGNVGVDDNNNEPDSLSFDMIAAIKKQQEETQPWTEKYRPDNLDGIVGQQGSIDTLRGLMLGDEATFPHVILCGPAGTGKTTTILAISKQLYGKHSVTVTGNQQPLSDMVMEINASDANGIEVVRKQISVFVSSKGSISASMGITVARNGEKKTKKEVGVATVESNSEQKKMRFVPKLIILDEADHLTRNAQNALRSLMEKHAEEVRFCFIVNYEHRMHDAIVSRCLRLRFAPLKAGDMLKLLRRVCTAESVDATDDALKAIVAVTSGDMRQAVNTLQSCAMHARSSLATLKEETVYRITGKPPPFANATLLKACFDNHNKLLENSKRISTYLEEYGVSLKSTIDAFCQLVVADPDDYKSLGFAHEAAVAHFILALEKEQRRIVLVTDSGRMRIHIAALAALLRRIREESLAIAATSS
jgi:replication factor C subunit 3/5